METNSNNLFFGIKSLLGDQDFELLKTKKLAIVGLGGVGSWVVEALARTGFENITLIDLDEVCVTNINRQLAALHSTVGKSKAGVLSERMKDINPGSKPQVILDFVTPTNLEEILGSNFDLVIDAIDSLNSKVHLISHCFHKKIPLITCGSAGGRLDITQITIDDLGKTINDKFLMRVRKKLKREHGFPQFKNKKFGIQCVYSKEIVDSQNGASGKACDVYLGSITHITGTFGFFLAHLAIKTLRESIRAD